MNVSSKDSLRVVRYAVQAFFLLLNAYIGWQFYRFVLYFEQPGHAFVPRPPSVDGYLPIGGLMAFKYFVLNGVVEPIHPAGLVLFIAIMAVSLGLKKGFCGWICPVGTVSQYAWMAGEKLFGRNFRIEPYTDIALRSIKYLLLGVFLFVIVIAMGTNMILLFFLSDYYKIADVRMLKFFTDMSRLTMWVLIALTALSLLYKNFWCRYLCPYGALLGLLSRLSPLKVRRSEKQCIHCHACTTACPSLIDVEARETVTTGECFGCLTCVSVCPAPGALDLTVRTPKGRRTVPLLLYPVLLVGLFYLIIAIGVLAGTWHSQVPVEDYQRLIPQAMEVLH